MGQTAAEIIYSRVDSSKENMGLRVWKNSPQGSIRETDVIIAKNYLKEKELDHLNRIVTMYLDFAEMQAKRGILMRMHDWVVKLDAFLKLNEQDKDYISDFDREVKKLIESKKKEK